MKRICAFLAVTSMASASSIVRADAIAGAAFDDAKANDGAQQRVKSAERLKDAVVKALREIHDVLNEEQRQKLAYLVRTGVVTL